MDVYNYILNIIEKKGAVYFPLIDPDEMNEEKLDDFILSADNSGVDGFLLGGSLLLSNKVELITERIKKLCSLPVLLFPGNVNQVSRNIDAILFLSLISGRNPEYLIGQHVLAAPLLKELAIQPIPTGYILIENGKTTSVEYISNTKPIPANKTNIVKSTALAGQYLGMKLIYLEAGSGAENSVPDEMIKEVSEYVDIPLIVGGGIKNPSEARKKVANGAKVVIIGNHFENQSNWIEMVDFAKAIHIKENKSVSFTV